MSDLNYAQYDFTNADDSHMHRHFMPPLLELCGDLVRPGARVLDVGCGNGATVGLFLARGCDVVGIDLSDSGLALAKAAHPQARFEQIPVDKQILDNLATSAFDLVVSTEVIEHLYAPREYAAGCFHALRPGGRFICSTPYHGYLKNLLIAVAGKNDSHSSPLWDGGHIKSWSRRTLSVLLKESGFVNLRFRGAGRLPFLWMTMLMSADRPLS